MNLSQLLQKRGLEVRKHATNPAEIQICCPFCTSNNESADTRFRLCINTYNDRGKCFNCGFKSRHISFWLKRILNLPLVVLDTDTNAGFVGKRPPKVQIPEEFVPLTLRAMDDDLFEMALHYVTKRGVTKSQIEHNRIGACFTGRYAYRIVFPVYFKKKLFNLVARDFTGQQKVRYLNSPGTRMAYNVRINDGKPSEPLILSEGIFKCLAIERAVPLYQSAALLGHSISPEMLQQLETAAWRNLILWPDPDPVGIRGVRSIAERLTENGFDVKMIWPPPKKQADELPPDHIQHLITNNVVKYDWSVDQRIKLLVS